MDATKKIFSRDPEVMGGELVVAGTRVEVKTLVVRRGNASPLLGVALVESGDLRVVGVEDGVPSARRVETVAGFGIPSGGEPFAFHLPASRPAPSEEVELLGTHHGLFAQTGF